jgi:phosphatidate cytidylyltransferase
MIARILTVLISVPIIAACTYFGGLWFFFLVAILAAVSLNEFYNLMRSKGLSPYYAIGNFFTLLFIVYIQLALMHPNWESASSAILTAAVIVTFSAGIFIRRTAMATVNTAITLLGMLYVGWLFSYLVLLRNMTLHGANLFFLLVAVWACDSAAYLFGKTFGKKQLSPYISPSKTVIGSIAGFIFAVGVAYVFGMLVEHARVPGKWMHYLILGAVIGVIAQISDLAESLIKRDAGAKDSSKLVPGHGGILDRMDSFVFTAPVVYYYLVWFVR